MHQTWGTAQSVQVCGQVWKGVTLSLAEGTEGYRALHMGSSIDHRTEWVGRRATDILGRSRPLEMPPGYRRLPALGGDP